MSTEEAIKPEVTEEENSQETSEGRRERSTIEFPYLDLDAAIDVAKGVHQVGGSSCDWDQLAAHLNHAAKGGGFRMRVMTAKTFGFVTYGQGTVTLTELGKRLNDPRQEKLAKADSFLAVPLYSRIYEQFKNGTLPPTEALENEIVNMGVAQKQKRKARQAFHRSAASAGYFWSGQNRLVRPAIKASSSSVPAQQVDLEKQNKEKEKPKEEIEKRHPLIEGLLKELPVPQSEWTTEDRKKWLEMASTIFNVIYRDSDDSRGMLKVVVEKNSAKQ